MISIGADPEIFVRKKYVVDPRPFVGFEVPMYGFSQYKVKSVLDNVSIELNFTGGTGCRDYFVPSIRRWLREWYLKFAPSGYKLDFSPVVKATKALLRKDEGFYEFGCEPARIAYTGAMSAPQPPDKDFTYRFGGGHMHYRVGSEHYKSDSNDENLFQEFYDNGQLTNICDALAILFDAYVALPMVAILGKQHDKGEAQRREFYGLPGEYRLKLLTTEDATGFLGAKIVSNVNFEYRTLSNRGFFLSPATNHMLYGIGKTLCNRYMPKPYSRHNDDMFMISERLQEVVSAAHKVLEMIPDLQEIIRMHDYAYALEICSSKPYRRAISDLFAPNNTHKMFFEAVIEAAKRDITWSQNIIANWGADRKIEYSIGVNHDYWTPDYIIRFGASEFVFPQREFLSTFDPKSKLWAKPKYYRPKAK